LEFFLWINASSLFSIKINFDFEDDSATGIASLALLIPLFAKNSRLGYFFNANNLTQTRLQIQSPDLRLEAVFRVLHIKFASQI
jgi:hypothetical protein